LDSGLDHLIIEFDPKNGEDASQLKRVFDQDLFTCVRFPVYDRSDLYSWAIGLVDAGANALSFYPVELEAYDETAHLNQQLSNKAIVIEHDLPYPVQPASMRQQIRLFSPEISENEATFYTILPDGSLIQQDSPMHLLGNLISAGWRELVVKE